MRLLFYGLNYAPEPIGVGRFSGELGAYLAANGTEVDVVTAPPHYPGWVVRPPYKALAYKTERMGGQRIVRCPVLVRERMRGFWRLLAPASFALASAPVVLWQALTRRPDAVLTVEPTLLAAPFGLLAARLCGARAYLYVQDLEMDAAFAVGHLRGGLARRLGLVFERFLLRRFDRIITISQQMRLKLSEKGAAPERIVIVRNWVDLEAIHPMTGPNAFRQELGLASDDFAILYAGNIGAKQGLRVMLDAAVLLKDEPGIVFVLAGEGPEKERLRQEYPSANVRFLPTQPNAKLCELLNAADMQLLPQDASTADLVLPSKLGGMLASGKTVLVTANPDTELHTLLYGHAILVPAGDSAAIAEAIKKVRLQRPPVNMAQRSLLMALFDARRSLPQLAEILSS